MIRALLFDLDDTLLDHTGAARDAVDQWCRELGLPEGQHARFAAIERKWFQAYERGEVSHHGQRAARCREFLGRKMSDAEALAAYDGYLSADRKQWRAFADALPTKRGIKRFGHAFIPMDEALAFAAADISGRPFLVFSGEFPQERVGDFDTCMTEEFFRAFATNAGITLHLKCEYGKNSHHMIEALFKAAAHALRDAAAQEEGDVLLSSKGVL